MITHEHAPISGQSSLLPAPEGTWWCADSSVRALSWSRCLYSNRKHTCIGDLLLRILTSNLCQKKMESESQNSIWLGIATFRLCTYHLELKKHTVTWWCLEDAWKMLGVHQMLHFMAGFCCRPKSTARSPRAVLSPRASPRVPIPFAPGAGVHGFTNHIVFWGVSYWILLTLFHIISGHLHFVDIIAATTNSNSSI